LTVAFSYVAAWMLIALVGLALLRDHGNSTTT
jgi:hypothetical protein